MGEPEIADLAEKARELGIGMEIGTRGVEADHLRRYLTIAKRFGSSMVRTLTHRLDEAALNDLGEVLHEYEKAGVAIALENHDEHTTRELASFIDRVGSPHIGVCLDTVNSFAALEAPETVVKNLAPYTLNLHVKDFEVVRFGSELGFSIVGRPAGQGRLDVEWIVDELKEAGRSPNAILELWTPFSGSLEETIERENEWAKQSIEYLKTVIQ
jgi:sugar phosphate isomerase/epimerase